MAMILDIADGVASALNGEVFSKDFTAVRAYVPSFKIHETDGLQVTVVPRGLERTSGTRSESQHDYQVDVGVQEKFEQGDAAELDPLMDLVEEIADFLGDETLDTDPLCACASVEHGALYVQEHMREGRVFTSVLTCTYRMWR